MIAQYTSHYQPVQHTVVEHDKDWVTFCKNDISLCERSNIVLLERELVSFREAQGVRVFSGFSDKFKDQNFDFICIDAPLGSDMKDYSRVDVLGLMPQILNKSFVLLLDDFDRPAEQRTAHVMEETLKNSGISYAKGIYIGLKKTLILCSSDNHFLTSL